MGPGGSQIVNFFGVDSGRELVDLRQELRREDDAGEGQDGSTNSSGHRIFFSESDVGREA